MTSRHADLADDAVRVLVVGALPESLVKFRVDLMLAMQQAGAEVHACAPGLLADEAALSTLSKADIHAHDVSISRRGMDPAQDLLTLRSLYRLMRRVKPSHVLCYTIKPVVYGMIAAKASGVPVRAALVTGLGDSFAADASVALKVISRGLYFVALRLASRVIFQNHDDLDELVRLGVISTSPANHVVPGSGVNTDLYTPSPLPPKPAFLFAARFLLAKGVETFLLAAELVRKERPALDTEFHLVGWAEEGRASIGVGRLGELLERASAINHGRVPDVRPYLSRCSVFVLPSFYREGLPRTILEALACGRGVITCDSVGCREAVSNEESGLLVPPKDVRALADAMIRLADDPALVERFGCAARQAAVKTFDVRKINERMIDIIGLSGGTSTVASAT